MYDVHQETLINNLQYKQDDGRTITRCFNSMQMELTKVGIEQNLENPVKEVIIW